MPNIKFNREAIEEIKRLGFFELWKINLIDQWNEEEGHSGAGTRQTPENLERLTSAADLINCGFNWSITPEGDEWWREHYNKLRRKENLI